MADLSDKEANDLFHQISQTFRSDDATQLSKLTEEPALDDKEEKKTEVENEEQLPDLKDSEDEDNKSGNTDTNEEEEEEESPQDKKPADKTVDEEDDKEETEELKTLRSQLDAMKKENQTLRSQAGRVPHVQRRLSELDKKLEELTKNRPSPSSQVATKLQEQINEQLKGIKKDDAELADAIAKAITAATQGVAEDSHTREIENTRFLREQEANAYMQEQLDILLTTYPNAPEVLKSPHWKEWKSKQSRTVQLLAESNTAEDVAYTFEKYKEDMIRENPALAPKKEEESVQNNEAVEKAKKIEEQRQRKKENSVDVRSPNGAGKVKMPDDPEALFKKISAELLKDRTGS